MVAYCRARERLRARERETRDERAEQNDAQRTIGGLLGESMARHNVECVALPPSITAEGGVGYVQLVRPGRRACAVRSVEDALSLLDGGVATCLPDVPREALPAAVARLVLTRRTRPRAVASPGASASRGAAAARRRGGSAQ